MRAAGAIRDASLNPRMTIGEAVGQPNPRLAKGDEIDRRCGPNPHRSRRRLSRLCEPPACTASETSMPPNFALYL
jgi:hypothetical protein